MQLSSICNYNRDRNEKYFKTTEYDICEKSINFAAKIGILVDRESKGCHCDP